MADFRDRGNRLFSEKKYDQALNCYSEAIKLNPHVATYYTNRALCYVKLNQWTWVIEDCQRAIELDQTLIKAHFFMGQAFSELGNYDDAIAALKRAHELAKEQNKNFGEDIPSAVRQVKKKRWSAMEEKRLAQQSDMQLFLVGLLKNHRDRQLLELKNSEAENTNMLEEVHKEYSFRLSQVNELISEVDSSRQRREVPDYLCGKISFELMTEPCITPSGITYERKDIEDHLQRVGHFDPVTRKPLVQEHLIPNLAMKEVVDTFVANNGWVEEY